MPAMTESISAARRMKRLSMASMLPGGFQMA
jgi:hypothetical protein